MEEGADEDGNDKNQACPSLQQPQVKSAYTYRLEYSFEQEIMDRFCEGRSTKLSTEGASASDLHRRLRD
ncbi:hypothetical protein CRG98_019144 [Punica granatum]|uniref:Uncharacterized protein n=1 Tax=Punica granatum TaxID=22663 RepID=A0A2I0JXA0_PUNGR|nr:hypothetical protein CRG98_019144 [Punica granatum]